MYHVEIRQFPHNVCRFNLSERELLPIAVPWAREEWVELGERKWNVNQAKLTIIEGPQLSLPQLAMGRGWRNAQRHGEDVTERVLETLRQAPAPAAGAAEEGGAASTSPHASTDMRLLADSLALEILAALDDGPVSPQLVWRLAAARLGERSAAESLSLGERAIRSLLERGLIVLQALAAADAAGEGRGQAAAELSAERLEQALRAVESWAGDDRSTPLSIRKA